MLRGATITDDYRTVIFNAVSVEPFQTENFRTVTQTAHLVLSLAKQLQYMVRECSHTFLGYNTENLLVIDGEKVIFLDSSITNEIDEDGCYVTLVSPFEETDFFLSPELKKVKEFPSYIHYKTAYFSLGCLLLKCLLNEETYSKFNKDYIESDKDYIESDKDYIESDKDYIESDKDYIESDKDYDVIKRYTNCSPLKDTKLYWLTLRCLTMEPKKRSLLFV
jgi:serine/threonine protein kinase